MMEPQYTVLIAVPTFAGSEQEARDRVMPYVRDMRVEAEIVAVRPYAKDVVPKQWR